MPFGSVKVAPGVNTIFTPTLNEAGISASNLIRFRGGLVEKVGGWTSYIGTAMDSITRAMHAWEDLSGNGWLATGNVSSVKAISNQVIYDVTPQSLTSNPALNVSTTKGSKIITIVDTNISNIQAYSSVFFSTPISVGGIVLQGQREIRQTPSGTSFTIEWLEPARSTVASGGSVPTLTTTTGSARVLVTLANHGVLDGDTFVFPISTIVGGLTISGIYRNCNRVSSSTFYITAANEATSAQSVSMNSGSARYTYGVVGGPAISISAGGIGPIGQYAIGEGFVVRSAVSGQTGTRITATDWTFDNWGEILIGCPEDGSVWYWDPRSGYSTMIPVGNGPAFNTGIFVAMPAQILVAYGSTSSIGGANTVSAQDKLIVRWSDQLDFLQWQVSSLTQAGSYHIPTGSEIRGGIQGPGIALIFTDVDVWGMEYIGFPEIFGFKSLYTAGGLVGKHAVCQMRGSVYWMGHDNFYVFTSGGVSVIPCPIWDNVFQDLDDDNMSKCVAAANSDFSEIWFFYPSASGGTGECDKYAKVNVAEGMVWDYGTLARSAWQPRSILGPPVAASPTNYMLYQHETGYSDAGLAMNSYFETGYFPVGDGENFVFVDELQPDMKFSTVNSSLTSATVTATLTAVNYPNDSSSMVNSLTMTSTTKYLTPRVRGRQAKWRVGSNDATSWWRTGNLRYRFSVDGRR